MAFVCGALHVVPAESMSTAENESARGKLVGTEGITGLAIFVELLLCDVLVDDNVTSVRHGRMEICGVRG